MPIFWTQNFEHTILDFYLYFLKKYFGNIELQQKYF